MFVFIRSKGYLPNCLSNKQLNPTCGQIEENLKKIYSDLAQGGIDKSDLKFEGFLKVEVSKCVFKT